MDTTDIGDTMDTVDTVSAMTVQSKTRRESKLKRKYSTKQYVSPLLMNAIPLETPSAMDLEDSSHSVPSETSKEITHNHFVDASDGYKGVKMTSLAHHLSHQSYAM